MTPGNRRLDVEEVNGGRVTLTGQFDQDRLHDGQRIRVHGYLIPAVDRNSPAMFHVQKLNIVD